jgi:hypothetical protein
MQRASICSEERFVDDICVVNTASHNLASVVSAIGPDCCVYVANVAVLYRRLIGLTSTGSLKNFSMTGCYVHCYIIRVVGRYRWV